MSEQMLGQIVVAREHSTTARMRTSEWLSSRVRSRMSRQLASLLEALRAQVAHEWCGTRVCPHVGG